jgi:hypothetical protein
MQNQSVFFLCSTVFLFLKIEPSKYLGQYKDRLSTLSPSTPAVVEAERIVSWLVIA